MKNRPKMTIVVLIAVISMLASVSALAQEQADSYDPALATDSAYGHRDDVAGVLGQLSAVEGGAALQSFAQDGPQTRQGSQFCQSESVNDPAEDGSVDIATFDATYDCDTQTVLFGVITHDTWFESELDFWSVVIDTDASAATGCGGYNYAAIGFYDEQSLGVIGGLVSTPDCDTNDVVTTLEVLHDNSGIIATAVPRSLLANTGQIYAATSIRDTIALTRDDAPDASNEFLILNTSGTGTTPVTNPPTQPPATARSTSRLAGPSRHATSVEISKFQFPSGAPRVYLSRDNEFADSISGASLTGGPVLLVPQCGPVPTLVLDEVRRLGATEVIALGGTGAICDQVLTDVANA